MSCSPRCESLPARRPWPCAWNSCFVPGCVAAPSRLGQSPRQVVQLCPGVFARNGEAKVTARRASRIVDKGGKYFSAEERPFEHSSFTGVSRNERNNRTGCRFLRKPRAAQGRFQAVHVVLQARAQT